MRQGKKPKILGVYDNGGETIDRYTVVFDIVDWLPSRNGGFEPYYQCLGLSENPEHPHGFSQWSNCIIDPDERKKVLGKKIKLSDLPKNVRKHIEKRRPG